MNLLMFLLVVENPKARSSSEYQALSIAET
nr:MAG TPA: hypothetical protein [Caudoviricetes sp.]